MKVKIGDQVYDAEKQPIMLILSDIDKENISNMHSDTMKYCAFPEDIDESEIKEWSEN